MRLPQNESEVRTARPPLTYEWLKVPPKTNGLRPAGLRCSSHSGLADRIGAGSRPRQAAGSRPALTVASDRLSRPRDGQAPKTKGECCAPARILK